MRTVSPSTLVFVFSCITLAACASRHVEPEPSPTDDPLARALPFDPKVRRGTLANGLTYYVEPNGEPKSRAELRLVIKAGSINESDDQRGLAHVVEHMAFNGTTHFSGNELVAYLESIGVRFGAHLNAYTSFDETVYQLQVPTDDAELLTRGLHVLSDWASGITFDPEEIDKERGVVLEEWRRTLGAGGRLRDEILPLTFKDSRYKERLPIGTEESLRSFGREQLVRYYEDWYRPELMAVIAVGDFDAARVEREIVETFSSLESPTDAPERTYAPVPSDHDTLYGVFTDPEVPRTSVGLSVKIDDREGNTFGDYRDLLVEQIALGIFNERMGFTAREPDAPFLGAGAGKRRITPIKSSYSVSAIAKEGRVEDALLALMTEVARFEKLGVNDAELERARKRLLASYATYYNEREKTSSRTHAEELVRVFTTGEAAPGVEKETEIARRLLLEIEKDDIERFFTQWLPDTGRVVTVVMPEKEGLTPPSTSDLARQITTAEARQFVARTELDETRPLVARPPTPGAIVSREPIEAIGAERWELSNGMTVLIKPTDFKEDQVLLSASSWGGTATASDEEFPSARAASSIAAQSGLADFDAVELSKALAGKRVRSSSGVGEISEGVSGGSSVEDLETLFQLTHLRFTSPRLDATGLALFTEQTKEAILNRLKSPETWFSDKYRELMWQGHARYEPWTLPQLEAVQLDRARAFYAGRFANAADFFVVIVGSESPETLEPLVKRYLASLPGDPSAREVPPRRGARRNPESVQAIVRRGVEPKARARLTLHGPFENEPRNRYLLGSVVSVLSDRLRDALREELGGTYSVGATRSLREHPVSDYAVSIGFESDPGRVEELLARAKEILTQMRREAPSETELQKLKAKQRRSRETAVRTNGFWLGIIKAYEQRGEALTRIVSYDELVEQLTAEDLERAAQKWFGLEPSVEVLLLPEIDG